MNAIDKAAGRITIDGSIVKAYNETTGAGTVAQNLTALDTAIGDRTYTQGTGYVLNGKTNANTITEALEAINTGIGDRQYTNNYNIADSETITASINKLDSAVGSRTGYRSGGYLTTSLNAINDNMIKSMTVNADGTITAEQVDGSTDIVSNAIHDYRLTGTSYDAATGKVILTMTDKYNTSNTENVEISGLG